jgi:NADPH-dependent 2,4-dienoyl-CoA reductase/sulfur reductase-like enzyme
MERLHVKYLIVGGGTASVACARAIRERDRGEPLLMVTQEISRAYDRSPLSKSYLRREIGKRDLPGEPIEFYTGHNIELRTGRRAAHLDVARASVTLDSGGEIFYEKLLLATGAMPRPIGLIGGDLPNTFYLKTIADADRLHHAIDVSRAAGGHNRAAVIGAGLLGVEVAASLAQVGMAVDLIQSHATPWPKIAGELTGRFVARRLRNVGVRVRENARATRLEGDGRVQRVVLDDGSTLPCDFAVAAVGVRPSRELLRNTPIAAESAILVDARGCTSEPNVYAAGDCCAILDLRFGKHRHSTHWRHAAAVGRVCGLNMAGGDATYDEATYYTTEIAGLSVHVWGDGRFVHHRLMRGNALNDEGEFAEMGVDEAGRVAQVIAVGRAGEHAAYESLVRDRATTVGEEEKFKNPDTTLSGSSPSGGG